MAELKLEHKPFISSKSFWLKLENLSAVNFITDILRLKSATQCARATLKHQFQGGRNLQAMSEERAEIDSKFYRIIFWKSCNRPAFSTNACLRPDRKEGRVEGGERPKEVEALLCALGSAREERPWQTLGTCWPVDVPSRQQIHGSTRPTRRGGIMEEQARTAGRAKQAPSWAESLRKAGAQLGKWTMTKADWRRKEPLAWFVFAYALTAYNSLLYEWQVSEGTCPSLFHLQNHLHSIWLFLISKLWTAI